MEYTEKQAILSALSVFFLCDLCVSVVNLSTLFLNAALLHGSRFHCQFIFLNAEHGHLARLQLAFQD